MQVFSRLRAECNVAGKADAWMAGICFWAKDGGTAEQTDESKGLGVRTVAQAIGDAGR